MTPPTASPNGRPDDRENRPGWHVALRRYPAYPRHLWSISVGHTGRTRPPRSRRQVIAWFVVLDLLGTALNGVTLIHAAQAGQRDGLIIALSLAAPTLMILWMWWATSSYRRNTRD